MCIHRDIFHWAAYTSTDVLHCKLFCVACRENYLSVSVSTTLYSVFVSHVPWHTTSVCVYVCVLHACMRVCDDGAKVLPHCLFSVSIASLCISVFFTASLAFNSLPKVLHRGSETPSMAIVIIFVWSTEVFGFRKKACTCLCSLWLHVYMGFVCSCVLLLLLLVVFFVFCSVRAYLRGGLFIRSVGRCVFCWHCMVQSLGLTLINSTRDPARRCAADWLCLWRGATT